MYTFGKTKTKNLCCVFQVNGDPDKGFDGQKLKNFKVEKKFLLFYINLIHHHTISS